MCRGEIAQGERTGENACPLGDVGTDVKNICYLDWVLGLQCIVFLIFMILWDRLFDIFCHIHVDIRLLLYERVELLDLIFNFMDTEFDISPYLVDLSHIENLNITTPSPNLSLSVAYNKRWQCSSKRWRLKNRGIRLSASVHFTWK